MTIVVLDYVAAQCDVIVGVPQEKVETDNWVEELLDRIGYRSQDCYWMALDPNSDGYESGGTIYEYGEGQDGNGDINTLDTVNF